MISRISIFVKFMLSGAPSFVLAVFFNIVLVEHYHVYIPLAYCVILAFQLFMNFVILKLFVFKSGSRLFDPREMMTFFSGVLGLRILDWLLYIFLTNWLLVYFLYAQIGNMALFSACRFMFAELILDKKQ